MTASCPKCGFSESAVVSRSWQFDVGREVKSLNASSTNHGTRRFAYRDERKGWEADMLTARRVYGVTLAVGLRRVTLTRLYGRRCRPFDQDGLVGGCKKIVDAMVKSGMLSGDSPAQAEVHWAQERSPDYGLRVLIEELEQT